MKTIGWLLIILGSNGTTAALVARTNLRYSLFTDHPWIMEIADGLGGIASLIGLAGFTEGLESLQRDIARYILLVDILFYVSVGILAAGLIVLLIGVIKQKMR